MTIVGVIGMYALHRSCNLNRAVDPRESLGRNGEFVDLPKESVLYI